MGRLDQGGHNRRTAIQKRLQIGINPIEGHSVCRLGARHKAISAWHDGLDAHREPIDALGPARDLGQPLFGDLLSMIFRQRFALAFEGHEGHTPAAARLNRLEIDQENLAGAREYRKRLSGSVPSVILRKNRTPASIEPQYKRVAVKRAHHDRDPPISGKMRVRFISRSTHIKIADLHRRKDAEAIHSLWTDVDPRFWRGCGDEKQRLLGNECDVIVRQCAKEIHEASANTKAVGLWDLHILMHSHHDTSAPGEVLSLGQEGMVVAAEGGAIRVIRVRPARGEKMPAAEWATG
jgi:Formyl transferase, C-terminal domain